MEPSPGHIINSIRDIERRTRLRPCRLADLKRLEEELDGVVNAVRCAREAQRAQEVLAAEGLEWRSAVQAARAALRKAMAEHEAAQWEVEQLKEMVRRGHVHEAARRRPRCHANARFGDLVLDFVSDAVVKQQNRQQWIFAAGVIVTGMVLIAIAIIEVLKRSTPN
jgi:hypothetical protein